MTKEVSDMKHFGHHLFVFYMSFIFIKIQIDLRMMYE